MFQSNDVEDKQGPSESLLLAKKNYEPLHKGLRQTKDNNVDVTSNN